MITITVDTIEEKNALLEESEYIHYFAELMQYTDTLGIKHEHEIGQDSNKAGMLMHIYTNPNMITVKQ